MTWLDPPRGAVVDAVRTALAEDLLPLGDLTAAVMDPAATAVAAIASRESGVLAGRACAAEAFAQVEAEISLDWNRSDGDRLQAGEVVAHVAGPLAAMLTAERTALNFLGHLSGIATTTAAYVGALRDAGSEIVVWDTRKTTPGLRALEKAAVRAGGGANHRAGLSDWIMLKDNHLAALGITGAVAKARRLWPGRTVHVECDRVDQAVEAARAGATALLLDNMSPDEVRSCVDALSDFEPRPLVEVSGGVSLDTISLYADLDVDCISIGRITSSAPVLDLGLDLEAPRC